MKVENSLIIDVILPIKIGDETRGIPVVGLSANVMDRNIKKALNMGFNSYIIKPLDIADFFDEINKVFDA
ncbi:MAG: response regulator [Nitrospinae bacterium]|nr:response regulator [Nitrospinota bacterium]